MSGYTKLFNSILTSTIWCQDCETRIVWITMLAMADKNGLVEATAPGIAKMAGVPEPKVRQVLDMLEDVDQQSRTSFNNGKRVKRVNGGYTLLNYKEYRKQRGVDDRKEYMRKYMRAYMRKRREAKKLELSLAPVNSCLASLAQAEAEADTYTYISEGGVLGGETSGPVNYTKLKTQDLKNQPIKCSMPGCNNPAIPDTGFCSDACLTYAKKLLEKQS